MSVGMPEVWRAVVLASLLAAFGCGSAAGSLPPPVVGPPIADLPVASQDVDRQIFRSDLLAVLDAGLGQFLTGVRTEPVLENGQFLGFRLLSLYPEDARFSDIGVMPGDVILSVNRQSVERPEQAFSVWESLRVASMLTIEYLRDGERLEVRFSIVE